MLTQIAATVSVLIGGYFGSITVAWLINRRELKRTYGRAPYNWRVYGWVYTYIPYLKSLQQKEQDSWGWGDEVGGDGGGGGSDGGWGDLF